MRPNPLTDLHPKGGGQGRNARGGAYNNRRWRRLRRRQLACEPLCQRCLAVSLVRPAEVVHHIEPHDNDRMKFWYGKLESLCRSCHEKEHGRTNDAPWIGTDGWPLPPEQQAQREREHMAKFMRWEADDANDEDKRRTVRSNR
jgi:hypothetical protein